MSASSAHQSAASSERDASQSSAPGVTSLLLGGTGLVALAVGAGFGISASGAWSDAKTQGCAHGSCPTPEAQSRADSAGSRADLATGGLAVGGALLVSATAVYFLLERPHGASSPASAGQTGPAARGHSGSVPVGRGLSWDAVVGKERVAVSAGFRF